MALSDSFITYTRQLMGEPLYSLFEDALNRPASVSIRLNGVKSAGEHVGDMCFDEGSRHVEWCPGGRFLAERPEFTFDPLFHAGMYYVQESSSMFLHAVMRQYVTSPVTMLDLCAAPGGKSTLAREALPDGSLLVSNEPVRQRANILSENLRKFGHEDVIVTNNYARDFQRAKLSFDVILTDVPCSGEGMFRKDEFAVEQWSETLVRQCQTLQREILTDIWPCLKTGGLLIYSTCTFNAHEDEENVAWICEQLGAETLPVEVDDDWNITASLMPDACKPVYRFIPGRTPGEGLFMAVMRKTGSEEVSGVKVKKEKTTAVRYRDAERWLTDSRDMALVEEGTTLSAIPQRWLPYYRQLRKSLSVMHAGVIMGTLKGKDIVPEQSLALARHLNRDAFPIVEVSRAEALSYLHKDAIMLPAETPRGFVLVAYRGVVLGFVKNLGNRSNNLYPPMWKIKSSHLPI